MASEKTLKWFNRFDSWDISGCLYFNHYCRTPTIQQFFTIISRLGDGVFWYTVALFLPVYFGKAGLMVTTSMLATGVVCLSLYKYLKKRLIRERPFIRSPEVFKGCAPLDRYSFPSGHTMHASSFSCVILWHFPSLLWLILPFAVLVAISRMVLGLHYPSDVLCGGLIGLVLGSFANWLAPII